MFNNKKIIVTGDLQDQKIYPIYQDFLFPDFWVDILNIMQSCAYNHIKNRYRDNRIRRSLLQSWVFSFNDLDIDKNNKHLVEKNTRQLAAKLNIVSQYKRQTKKRGPALKFLSSLNPLSKINYIYKNIESNNRTFIRNLIQEICLENPTFENCINENINLSESNNLVKKIILSIEKFSHLTVHETKLLKRKILGNKNEY